MSRTANNIFTCDDEMKTEVKRLAIEFRRNGKLEKSDASWLALSTKPELNKFYLTSWHSWQITESILDSLFWVVFCGKYNNRKPDNWLELITY